MLSRAGLGVLDLDLPIELIVPGSYGPLLAALLVQRASAGTFRIASVFSGIRDMGVGLLAGAVALVLAFVALPALWLTGGDASQVGWMGLAGYPQAMLLALVAAGPIGEEPGWRGFALPRLQARLHPVAATLVLGVLWTVWHLPLFAVTGWASLPFPGYLAVVVALSVILTAAFNLSRGSLLVVILIHAMFNGSPRVLATVLDDSRFAPAYDVPSSLLLIVSFWAVALTLMAVTRGSLGYRTRR